MILEPRSVLACSLYFLAFGAGLAVFSGITKSLNESEPGGIPVIPRIMRIVSAFCIGAGIVGLGAVIAKRAEEEGYIEILAGGILACLLAVLLEKYAGKKTQTKTPRFKPEKAVILTPMPPGFQGKAAVKRFGKKIELDVRCKNKKLGFIKGAEVRIVACEEHIYWIEPF